MTYSVLYWGSHPDAENDDLWTGVDVETAEAAMEQYLSDESPFRAGVEPGFMRTSCAYVQIDGPDLHGIRRNPLYSEGASRRERALDDAEWRSESRWQDRMSFGLAAEDP